MNSFCAKGRILFTLGILLAGVSILAELPLLAEPSAAVGEGGQLSDWERKFPCLVFEDDFGNHADGDYPDGWEVLLNRNLPKARVMNGAFEILTGGNIHVIQSLSPDNFLLKYRIRGRG